MDKLFKMDPNYTPTSNILFRTSVFKVMKTLERVKDATSRESCWRDLILLLVPVVSFATMKLFLYMKSDHRTNTAS
jgi:hypothetical protein